MCIEQTRELMRSPAELLPWKRRTPAELMELIGTFPLVVSQRYHFTVLALMAS